MIELNLKNFRLALICVLFLFISCFIMLPTLPAQSTDPEKPTAPTTLPDDPPPVETPEEETEPEKPAVEPPVSPELQQDKPAESEIEDGLKKLNLILKLIKTEYVHDISDAKLFENAFKGMLGRLDPYSTYFTPGEYKNFMIGSRGEFGGIGIVVSFENGLHTVITPLEDTPAFRAGLLPGDRILEINGILVETMSRSESNKLVRGKPGTQVTLTILHKGANAPEKITITREIIKLKSVKQARIVDEEDQIGYIRIVSFQEDTVKSFDDALTRLKEKGLKSLIIDLRFNGGGLMNQAIGLANRFIPNGVIVSTRGRDERDNVEIKADPEKATCSNLPLVVLINGGTASASEIFSGAIQDHSKGILLGSRSYGKAAIQTIIPIPASSTDRPEDKSAVKLTVAKYYTPSGKLIQRETNSNLIAAKSKQYGLEPDVLLEMTTQQTEAMIQARRAEVIKKIPVQDNLPLPRDKPDDPAPPEEQPPEKPVRPDQPGGFIDIQLAKAIEILKGNNGTDK